MVFVWLPVFVEVKGVDASMCGTRGNVRRARSGARRGAGRVVGRTVALRRSRWTRLSAWEDKVEKVEKQECSVDVVRKWRRLEDDGSRESEETVEMEVEQSEETVEPASEMDTHCKLPTNVGCAENWTWPGPFEWPGPSAAPHWKSW